MTKLGMSIAGLAALVAAFFTGRALMGLARASSASRVAATPALVAEQVAAAGLGPKFSTCLQSLSTRSTQVPVPHHWEMRLSVGAAGDRAQVADAQLAEGSSWPPSFDRQAQDCYVAAFRGLALPLRVERGQVISANYALCVHPENVETKED
jgi:hypothetical protein